MFADFLKALESMGPFTAPLCIGMAYALWWVTGQLLKERADNKALLMQRAEDQAQDALAYAEYGETMRNVIRDSAEVVRTFNVRAEAVLARAAGG